MKLVPRTIDITLKEIIKGCQKGRSKDQERIYKMFYGLGMSICRRYANNNWEAEEIVNTGFLKVFKHIKDYKEEGSFKGWFSTLMIRTAIDHYRKNHHTHIDVDINEIHYLGYENDFLDKLSAEEIIGLIQKLPPVYRTVFSLFIIEGYSHAEIATQLRINEGTSRSNLAKARAKMQEMIKIYYSEFKDIDNV